MKHLALTIGFASALLVAACGPSRAEYGLVGLATDILAVPNVALTESVLLVCKQRLTQNEQEHAFARKLVVGPTVAMGSCFQPRR